jgi:hypothetical protein
MLFPYCIIQEINIGVNILSQREPGSSVSVVSGYGLDKPGDLGSIPGRGERIFPLSSCVQTGSGAHLAPCTMGTRASSPRAKARPGLDADHPPSSSAEVENE